MDALEAIFTRRSTRRMKAELPPPELIQNIIEAGRAAPSGSNSQTTTGGLILGYGYDGLPVRSELKRTGNPVTYISDGDF